MNAERPRYKTAADVTFCLASAAEAKKLLPQSPRFVTETAQALDRLPATNPQTTVHFQWVRRVIRG